MTNVEAALAYARQGLRVHPCAPATKRPLTRWSQRATTIEADIRSMWRRWPDALVAVCTGDDGLVVVDVDPRHGGEFDEDLALTRTATTPGGGWHHWFRNATPTQIGNAVNLLPGVDIRGHGGYVIAPPSPGYAWLNDAPVLMLPDEILVLMQQRQRAARYGPGFEPATQISEGGRNDYIARFAGWLIREFEPDEDELVALVEDHNDSVCVPPLARDEIVRTTLSILRRHRDRY